MELTLSSPEQSFSVSGPLIETVPVPSTTPTFEEQLRRFLAEEIGCKLPKYFGLSDVKRVFTTYPDMKLFFENALRRRHPKSFHDEGVKTLVS